jgi:drug/metabolite transporter (DMT)-like permease
MKKESEAYLWGLLGISGFALTLPATKVAIPLLGVIGVGLGRAVLAGIIASTLLIFTQSKVPNFNQLGRLAIVALGVIFGFPLFSAYAMQYVPASHGAIIVGLIPLFTAIFAVLFAQERPSVTYWLAGLVGSSAIVIYSVYVGGGSLHHADLALLLAVISAAIGYAEGARLAREMKSWLVICYALVLSLPWTILLCLSAVKVNWEASSLAAWSGFFYVSLISMLLAFFAWYKGLELGGIAKIGQLQLIQPFITIFASAFFFAEKLSIEMFITLAVVLLSVYFGRKSRVIRLAAIDTAAN